MFKKNLIFLLAIFAFSACQNSKNKTLVNENTYSIFLGTYTDGESEGIYKMEMDANGKLKMLGLHAKSENPSFLSFANNGKTLLAANEMSYENNMGTVESYQISDSLTLISRKASGGAHPCFVTANEKGVVLTANYTGGNIGYFKLDKDGKLTDLLDVQQHTGVGTIPNRQDKPHAHSVWFQPNFNQVVAVDLGTNELWISRIDSVNNKLVPAEKERIALADGAGPRHLAFHPTGKFAYVINELDNTISVFEVSTDQRFTLIKNISTLPDNFTGVSYPADIHISSDGKFLYGSNRGHNSIVIFRALENGELKLIAHESTRGDHPRNFSLSPDEKFLLVANMKTNNIVSFLRDQNTGLLTFVDEVKAPKPACVLFER